MTLTRRVASIDSSQSAVRCNCSDAVIDAGNEQQPDLVQPGARRQVPDARQDLVVARAG
jgi:hypothetical protein